MIRSALLSDAPDLARLHVECWRETYTGLLPDGEIAARTEAMRLDQWLSCLKQGATHIAILPGLGFAQAGPQRDASRREVYPEELYCLYLLRAGQGRGYGRDLLAAVRSGRAMTALVLEGNVRACTFYQASGGRIIDTLPCRVGNADTREQVFAWAQT